ncbi:MAG TPA: hypothetical protein PLK82_05925, partial [Bacteroidales bacterium]|nr:hypothetical protein [Bacteroidales bacterium]
MHHLFTLPSLLALMAVSMPVMAASWGDYRTKASGNWNQVSVWEYFNGVTWMNAYATPTFSDEDITIRGGHTVTVTADLTTDETTIQGILIIPAGVTLTIANGSGTDLLVSGTVTVNGTLVNNGTVSSSASEMTFTSGSLYQHGANGGSLAGATWNDGSTCEVTGITTSTSITNTDQSFYHFRWNCASQTDETNCAGNLQTIRGNLTLVSTGSTGKLKLAESADYTLTITGNWDHQGGTLNMGGGTSNAIINLYGNFSLSGGKITELNSTDYYTQINFVKAGEQTFTKSGGVFENNIDFGISSGTTLNTGTSVVDGSAGQFSVNSGSTLRTSHPDGIANSGAAGSIQTASRYYSFAANYHYDRNGAQSTGNGLPSPLNGKLLIGSGSSATNLTITNSSVTINGTLLLCSSNLANSTIASGTVTYGSAGTLEYQGLTQQTVTLMEWPVTSPPVNVRQDNGYGLAMNGNRTVAGTLTLSQGTFSVGHNTLTLNGTLTRVAGVLAGSTLSNVNVGGSSPTPLELSAITLDTLVLNRASGLRLAGDLTIAGAMVMTLGNVSTVTGSRMIYQASSRLIYNGSATQSTMVLEFPDANSPPSLEIDKPAGSTLALTLSRLLQSGLYLKSGNFSLGSNSLTINGQISRTSGILIGGAASSLTFAGTGLSTVLPEVTLLNLTINRSAGIFLDGSVTVGGTLYLTLGGLYLQDKTLTINGAISRSSGMLVGNSQSALVVGPNASATALPGVTVGYLTINRAPGITLSGNVTADHELNLQNGTFTIGPYSLTLNGSLNFITGTLSGGTNAQLLIGGAASPISIPALTLSTLRLSRAADLTFNGDMNISGLLSLLNGNCLLNGHLLILSGTVQYAGGNLVGSPASEMIITGGGAVVGINSISLKTLTLSRITGISLLGNLDIQKTFTLQIGTVTRNGYQMYGPTAGLRYQGTLPQTTTDEEFPATGGPFSLEIQNPQGVTLHASRTIPGNLTLSSGTFTITGKELTLHGNILYQPNTVLEGGNTANLVLDTGTVAAQIPAVKLNNLTINRAAGVMMKGNCTVNGILQLLSGVFNVAGTTSLTLAGLPVTGATENLVTSPGARLLFVGSNPGFSVPASVEELAYLYLGNPEGVMLQNDLVIDSSLTVSGVVDLQEHVVSGMGNFRMLAGSGVITGHPDGVIGSIMLGGEMEIDGQCDYSFNGATAQLTGFLPTTPANTLRNLVISNTSTAGVTLDSDMSVTGTLDILPGSTLRIDPSSTLLLENDLT